MPTKLATTAEKIVSLHNKENSNMIKSFHEFMKSNGASERHQNNNLKSVISFANFLGSDTDFRDVGSTNLILSFLNTKIKSQQDDPEKRCITTWNDNLHRIKHFFRWLHNTKINKSDGMNMMEDWITPPFLNIKDKKTKRISPYLETELWEKEDLFTIIKYESYKRNKAILSLLWDLDARPHEVTMLRIKHIRLKKNMASYML